MTTPVDEDEFTQLVDPDISRMDQVEKTANGTPWLIAKAAAPDGTAALFDPEYVRDLVAKADGEPQAAAESVTVTGSPGAIARLMKDAADRAGVRAVAKADLSTADINDLPDSAFAYIEPGGEKDESGKTAPRSKRHFPVHDEAHVRNALSRAPQSPFGDKAMPKIRAAAKHFGVQVAKADGDSDPGSPAWEGQDADTADGIVQAILALRPRLQAFAAREGAEVAAGEMGDLCDVFDLQAARDCLMQAAKLVGGVAVAEHAESGPVAKATTTPAADAATSPQESTVTETPAVEATAAAPAAVAKGDAVTSVFSEGEMARLYKEAAEKAARKAIKKAAKAAVAQQTSGAAAAPEDARTIPGTDTVQAPAQAPDEVTKAAASIATAVAAAMAPVTKQLGELVTQAGSQSERVEKALAQPDDRRSPMLNGATGEPMLADRGGNSPVNTPAFQEIRKALDALPDGPAKEEAQRKVALSAIKARFGNS